MKALIGTILMLLMALSTGCGLTAANPTTNTSTSTSSSAVATPFTISQFVPSSGNVTGQPTSIQIQFSTYNINSAQASSSANYMMNCAGTTSYASSVSYSLGLATVTFPNLGTAAGTTCSVIVSSAISTTGGTYLSGILQADYYLSSTASTGTFSWNEVSTVSYTSGAGGNGGSSFSDAGADTLALFGLTVSAGTYLNSVQGVWARSNETQVSGTARGTVGTTSTVSCPTGYRMTGIYGYYGSVVNAIGIICKDATQAQYFQSGLTGTSTGTAFSYTCSSGQFATVLYGRAGTLVDQIGLGCR